ncbi:MAG: anthranilate phosphoribosyltransferase [Fibrobacterales bacterium]
MIKEAIKLLIQGTNLSKETTIAVFNQIMSGEATDAQIGAYLIAQRMTGESKDEIAGAAHVMREKVTPIPMKTTGCVDTCGTGGDASGSFNISTTAAFVVAGAGVPVAKHGNRSISSKSGSSDVLASLGLNLDITPSQAGECIDSIGISFLYAPLLHPAMKNVVGPRREIAQRSIFNVLGPLTNPAGAKRQVMGVFDQSLTPTLAAVLGDLDSEHVWVVAGDDGIDEISICDATQVSEYKDGQLSTFKINPTDYGFAISTPDTLLGEGPDDNARILKEVLSGKLGPCRDIVVLNAGAAIYVGGKTESFKEGIEKAKESIDSGAALKTLEALIEKTNSFK